MSIRCSGLARRSFIIGSRLWPPAITRASEPRRCREAITPSTLVARSYSNGAGVCIAFVLLSFGHPRPRAADRHLGVVLDWRVLADHRRARHQLRVRLADIGIQGSCRQAAVIGVA